ncbi:hypothetical protein CYMTET_34055 [Cymbomonas tetramitiformis]|uniref:Uncharacterized protein n=1 Tax=Cymbomonas tetramitiformis TaxID=36881 RepID=A0AAE0KQC3_9CHLO|nr:hypothetical protein CYMTET_34055 [Cymbomonas tetramitiformis]
MVGALLLQMQWATFGSDAWRSTAMAPLAASCASSSADPPVLGDEASLGSGTLSIGMLLDCDQQMVYVAIGKDSD